MLFFLQRWVKNTIFVILLLAALLLLAGYATAGWQSRYLADDYCYDAQFSRLGFWQGQIDSYINLMPYSSNRYALTLFSGIAWALGGVKLMPMLPGAAILLWGLALFYAIRQGGNYFARRLPVFAVLCIAATTLFYTLLLAPNRYQVLFWRSGMLPYLAPLVLNTFLVGQFFASARTGKVSLPWLLGLGLLAWLAAGFSETVFAIQTGFWGLVLLLALWRRQTAAQQAAMAILVGTLLGLPLLLFNPTNAVRQGPFPPSPPLWQVALIALQFARDFFISSVRAAWLPFGALTGAGLLLGWLELPPGRFKWRQGLVLLGGLLFGTYLLLVCSMAPTIWSMSAYPDQRGLLPGTYLLTLLFFSLGVWLGAASGELLHSRFSQGIKAAAGGLLLLALSAYLLHFMPSTYSLIGAYRARARAWDARNAEIINAQAQGQNQLVVAGIDSIAQIFELQPAEGHWVNNCAATYYHLQSIKTTQ